VNHPRHADPLPLGGVDQPYSKGLMARVLVSVGVRPVRAYELARHIDNVLTVRGEHSLDLEQLEELAIDVLGESEGADTIRRLRRYADLRELDLPVILLVGGATGTGKSTVATEAAYRLGITRVTSTDFVRQTMRAFFSLEFMPSIHYSSFEASLALMPDQADDPLIAGFLEQTRNVLVGVRASIERALQEGWSMVLEGVHLVPGLLPTQFPDTLVVPCMLSIVDETAHAQHFLAREGGSQRPRDKYFDRFREIRRLQDYLVSRAVREGVPVIENESADDATAALAELVLAAAEQKQPRERV